MVCFHMQAQAYALGVSQQAAIYGGPVTAGDGGVLLDSQGAPLGAAAGLFISPTDRRAVSLTPHLHLGSASFWLKPFSPHSGLLCIRRVYNIGAINMPDMIKFRQYRQRTGRD